MKKLLVFLSIFAVLFVSTIRPLQAESLEDNFMLYNGNTYFLIISQDYLSEEITIATKQQFPLCEITLFYNSNSDAYLQVFYQVSDSSPEYFYNFALNYVGNIDSYFGHNNIEFENALVFSFVWNMTDIGPLEYDDNGFNFDTSNPLGSPVSIYDSIYNLINKFVFGNSIEIGSHQDLTATILSTCICVLVFALPFLIIWKVIKIIMG